MRARFDKRARRDAFAGTTDEDFTAWRRESRRTLTELLGLDRMEKAPTDARIDGRVTIPASDGAPEIVREHVVIQVEPGIYMTLYLLIPERSVVKSGSVNAPQVYLALPGHMGAGKESIAGRAEIPAVADSIRQFNYDYGLRLARMGYIVACPDCRGFGERRDEDRRSDSEEDFLNSTCFQLSHMAEGLGETVCGMCTWDAMRLMDYLAERGREEGWQTDAFGCVGFSGGGMQTLWTAAMDDRVTIAVISGYLYGYRDSLLVLNSNCSCNYIPRLWEHFDMGDVASLIAPRRLFVQSCRDDHLNGPRGLDNVREQLDIVRAAYRLFDAEDRLTHDIREGGHCFHPEILDALL
ncbi:MAG: hypothetical protein K6G16_04240 [Lachnospiraceae bacterium]|nr:hypothetical protein [Lachnospiraceae bacterium]